MDEFVLRPPPTELAVERIPALVREGWFELELKWAMWLKWIKAVVVDTLLQTLAATPVDTILSEVIIDLRVAVSCRGC